MWNVGDYKNERVDTLIEMIGREMDTKKRLAMIREAVELHKKDFAVIPIHQQMLTWGMTRRVQVIQRPDDFLELSSVVVKE